ncbi:hypothetical protein BACCIP111899_04361 [Bacillus rhizoplanae]|uniref:DUF4306 domain-containing protein n=1 Tax=Bacillus rhizoplanae TaxID=2880966 RepID=A0ABM8YHA9_9BACI|nr:YjdJ family protein [Bacillus rhizoplanae]CAG9615125.1 hypothetical protein BACCIP111899_04361 [Bacillus rhizoplanae]
MKIRYLVQFGLAFILLFVSTLISWYQGSNLIYYPSEWKYSAKFTNYFRGPVSEYHDILQIDFFIYAAKFHPISVFVMIVSFMHILILSLYLVFKRKKNNITK